MINNFGWRKFRCCRTPKTHDRPAAPGKSVTFKAIRQGISALSGTYEKRAVIFQSLLQQIATNNFSNGSPSGMAGDYAGLNLADAAAFSC